MNVNAFQKAMSCQTVVVTKSVMPTVNVEDLEDAEYAECAECAEYAEYAEYAGDDEGVECRG